VKKNYFVILIVIAAVVLSAILLFAVFQKKSHEEAIVKPDDIEKVNNLLRNYSFEKLLDTKNDWSVKAVLPFANYGYDVIVKYDSAASLVLVSDSEDQPSLYLSQRVDNINVDRKLSLFGFIRTEDCDSVRLEIELYDKDSLIIKGFSDCAKGTTDWTEYNAWIKSFLPANVVETDLYAIVRCVVYGKGRAWFDKVRLYSLPEKASIYDMRNYF
jgi:hypothetical protein